MNQRRLLGQVAIVTGAGAGIGAATAHRLAAEGAAVLIAELSAEAAERQAAAIRAAGGAAEALRTDVALHADVRAMVERAVQRWGRLDILVNNAYSPGDHGGGAVETPEDVWDHGMAVLVKSIFLAARYAVPAMRQAGGGSIVNMASVHGLLMAPGQMIYESGKSAVIGLTRQLATEFGPDGIRVNAICPGHILTEKQRARWDENPDALAFFEQQYPLRRVGQPGDIANAVAFLCSPEASFITGHALVVDGGLSIQLQENLGVNLARYIQQHPNVEMPY